MTFPVSCFIVAGKMAQSNQRASAPLVDRAQMGRLIRAARTIAGFDRVEDAATAVTDKTGYKMSARTLYSLERGEQSLTLEHLLAIVMTFEPPGSIVFFNGGYRPDVQGMLQTYGKEAYGGGS